MSETLREDELIILDQHGEDTVRLTGVPETATEFRSRRSHGRPIVKGMERASLLREFGRL